MGATRADKIIKSELTGVFNWLLNGLNRLIEQDKFTECTKANSALSEFRKQSDSVALFIDDKNYIPSINIKESVAELYNNYKFFCSEDGYKPCGKNRFSNRLVNKRFEKTRLNNGSSAFFIESKNCIDEKESPF
jgi:putative DNA primase/helicase